MLLKYSNSNCANFYNNNFTLEKANYKLFNKHLGQWRKVKQDVKGEKKKRITAAKELHAEDLKDLKDNTNHGASAYDLLLYKFEEEGKLREHKVDKG